MGIKKVAGSASKRLLMRVGDGRCNSVSISLPKKTVQQIIEYNWLAQIMHTCTYSICTVFLAGKLPLIPVQTVIYGVHIRRVGQNRIYKPYMTV